MPWAQTTVQFLLVCTLLEVLIAARSLHESVGLYFGVAHSSYCVKLDAIPEISIS